MNPFRIYKTSLAEVAGKKSWKSRLFLALIMGTIFLLPALITYEVLKKPFRLSSSSGMIDFNYPDSELNSYTSVTIDANYSDQFIREKFPLSEQQFSDLAFETCANAIKSPWLVDPRQQTKWLKITHINQPVSFESNPLNLGIIFTVKKAEDVFPSWFLKQNSLGSRPSLSPDDLVLTYRFTRARIARNYSDRQAAYYTGELTPEDGTQLTFAEARPLPEVKPNWGAEDIKNGSPVLKDVGLKNLDIVTGAYLPSYIETPLPNTYKSEEEQTKLFERIISNYCEYYIRPDMSPDYTTALKIESAILERVKKP